MRREIIFVMLYKFLGFRKNGSPFYRSYFLFRAKLPRTLEDFEKLMARARREAERIMNYYGLKINDVERIVIFRQGVGKGHNRTQLVNVFKGIGVDKNGKIVWMIAPSKNVNPEAYAIYNQYKIKKLKEKYGRDEALARLMGIRLEKPKIKLGQVRKFGDRNPDPDELVGYIRMDFQEAQEDTLNMNNVDPQLPDPPHKVVERSIIHRRNLGLIDHDPFKL